MTFEPRKEPLRITDHACVRFMERAMGVDVESVRQKILKVCEGPHAAGAVSVRAHGVKFEISGGAVVTVVPDHRGPSRTARDRNQHRIAKSKVTA